MNTKGIAISEDYYMRGPIRTSEYKADIPDNSKLVKEEDRRICNNGYHYYFITKITKFDPFIDVYIKWECSLCKKVVEKTVSPLDD
jgi:hypothetical protein